MHFGISIARIAAQNCSIVVNIALKKTIDCRNKLSFEHISNGWIVLVCMYVCDMRLLDMNEMKWKFVECLWHCGNCACHCEIYLEFPLIMFSIFRRHAAHTFMKFYSLTAMIVQCHSVLTTISSEIYSQDFRRTHFTRSYFDGKLNMQMNK